MSPLLRCRAPSHFRLALHASRQAAGERPPCCSMMTFFLGKALPGKALPTLQGEVVASSTHSLHPSGHSTTVMGGGADGGGGLLGGGMPGGGEGGGGAWQLQMLLYLLLLDERPSLYSNTLEFSGVQHHSEVINPVQ